MKTARPTTVITALCLLFPCVGYGKELPVTSPEDVGMSPEARFVGPMSYTISFVVCRAGIRLSSFMRQRKRYSRDQSTNRKLRSPSSPQVAHFSKGCANRMVETEM